jgi:hypothetical protein
MVRLGYAPRSGRIMDSIPFLHANRLFTIFFLEDLAFKEVRQVLDYLLARDAFHPDVQVKRGQYTIHLEETSFSVWVTEMDVIIQRIGSRA